MVVRPGNKGVIIQTIMNKSKAISDMGKSMYGKVLFLYCRDGVISLLQLFTNIGFN